MCRLYPGRRRNTWRPMRLCPVSHTVPHLSSFSDGGSHVLRTSLRVCSKWCVERGQGIAEDIGQDSSKNIPAHLFFTLYFRLVSFTMFSNYRRQIFVSECQTFTTHGNFWAGGDRFSARVAFIYFISLLTVISSSQCIPGTPSISTSLLASYF